MSSVGHSSQFATYAISLESSSEPPGVKEGVGESGTVSLPTSIVKDSLPV